jgi:hypothetical protein
MTNTKSKDSIGLEALNREDLEETWGGFPWGILIGPSPLIIELVSCFIEGVKEGYNAPPI